MPNAKIPKIDYLTDSVLTAVGENVQVYYYEDTEDCGRVRYSSYDIVDQIIADVFTRENIEPSRGLEKLCTLVARAAVKKLVTKPGLSIEFGDPPREIIDVNLRPGQTLMREADVTVEK